MNAPLLSGKLLQNTDFFTIRQGDVPVINSPFPFHCAIASIVTTVLGNLH